MFCSYCGTSLRDGAQFCYKCGKPQKTTTDAQEAQFPEQATPQSGIPLEIGKFIEYLDTNRGIRSVRHIVALATHSANPPALFNTLPRGDVFLYPHFLVFLTLTQGNYGAGMLVGKFVQEAKAMVKLHAWLAHPASFLADVAKSLSEKYSREDLLEKALNNPNSIFIPLDEVTSVTPRKNPLQGSYIKISTAKGNAVLCQDMNSENLFKASMGYFSTWEPQIVAALQEAVRRNRASNR